MGWVKCPIKYYKELNNKTELTLQIDSSSFGQKKAEFEEGGAHYWQT